MRQSVLGALLLAWVISLSAAGQVNKDDKANPAAKANSRKKPTPAAPLVSATPAPVVPSWLPPEAPLQPTPPQPHDLLDTKLDLRFDWAKQRVMGTALLTLRPHFYPQTQVVLDAKGFEVKTVALVGDKRDKSLTFNSSQSQLVVTLDRSYNRTQTYQLRIAYVAKPNELPVSGSAAITSDKGLFFINPLGIEANKPRQIWTQGETQNNSRWFPTIDRPNQRMTQEITLTVEDKYKTLSNGLLVSSKKNADGTRTDTWRQSLPAAPYLAMIAVGEYEVVSETWHNKALDYYVEPKYKPYAKLIFGRTPEMMDFFSKKLGVEYPWEKYAQVAVRDYVSGAMENTTAVVHGADIQSTRRELLDKNPDDVICHELFHHWFGDYVTCESWGNLPLNESFADYSEYLWAEFKQGPDAAALVQQRKLNNYLEEASAKREPLIRYRYFDREDMFDRHSYDKGGRVLHMLRKYVGDDAFFAALNRYLTQNKYSAVEISKLRVAFEETTGEDLMWFFDQWFMRRGHPELKISHSYAPGQVTLHVQQVQDTLYQPVFRLPVTVTVWQKDKPTDHRIVVSRASQTFTFPAADKPSLVKFDSEGQLLAQIDEERNQEELMFQFYHARNYLQKYEALDLLQNKTTDLAVSSLMRNALNDNFYAVRATALDHLRGYKGPGAPAMRAEVQRLVAADPSSQVRAQALATLATYPNNNYGPVYLAALNDSSYLVAASAVEALARNPSVNASKQLAALENTPNATLIVSIARFYGQYGGLDQYQWFLRRLNAVPEIDLYSYLESFGTLMTHIPAVERDKGLKLLENYARTHPNYMVRLGAYRGLHALLASSPKLKTLLQDIRAKETDDRLKTFYNLM